MTLLHRTPQRRADRIGGRGPTLLLTATGDIPPAAAPSVAPEAGVERRQHQQRQQRRADQAADHDGGERPLHLRAGAGRDRHRHEAERGDQRRHHHRPQPRQRAFDGLPRVRLPSRTAA